MSLYAALALYPLWAVSVLFAATALRLGRAPGLGVASLSGCMALWVSGLILLEHPATASLAERMLPAGMLLAGTFVHAGLDAFGEVRRRRGLLVLAYGFGALVALLGALRPGLFHAPGLAGPGPLFWPLFVVGGAGAIVTVSLLLRASLLADGPRRRRLFALTLGCVFGTAGAGVSAAAQLLGYFSIRAAAPLLLPAVALVVYAVLAAQPPAARALFRRAIVYALLTATLAALALPLLVLAAPALVPEASFLWLAPLCFCAALTLDALRSLVVDHIGRRLLTDPIGVADLAERAERSEIRAEHAETLAQIGALASAVAHEVRNPLGVIQAHAKLLEKSGARPASVDALRREVDRAKRFLDELLRYARPAPLTLSEVPVASALQVALEAITFRHDERPEVTVDIPARLTVEADRDGFGDVLVILLDNAVAALHGRGGAIVVRGRSVDRGVELSVQDDGPGVPASLEARLFTPFVSGRGRDHAHPGTGLGLAIAARWLERHGGGLRHEPVEGGGARFVSFWPAR